MADLADLRAIPSARARLDVEELDLIDRARRDGATWGEIADALGLGSRQAAEQRRLRLVTAVRDRPSTPDEYGQSIADLREAALELHRRVGADRRWDRRFNRAVLVRETLSAVPGAAGGALFALIEAVIADLDAAFGSPAAEPGPEAGPKARPEARPGAGVDRRPGSSPVRPLPAPTRGAVDRLRAALTAASPRH
ncbi:hypothetical protein [Actinoplanes solisilvae]|uniref:hypothetical protein n=1 Tax=Actinoplanes solisilvae TaxID=2486853 RepID=UPI000FDB83C6|nr:hypothetical protein [Actinoplanes solisilvae]